MGNVSPKLTEADQRAAIAWLHGEARAERMSADRLRALTAAVWASNTPHELYRRTHGLLGDRHRRDARDWWRIVALYALIAAALVLLTWLTAMAARDGLFGSSSGS
jgi:ferric-dicitrate binding protein FerR (iron transport regulator)